MPKENRSRASPIRYPVEAVQVLCSSPGLDRIGNCACQTAWWTYGIVFERYCGIDSIYGWLSDFDQLVGLRAVS
jgi:hypothetical protein